MRQVGSMYLLKPKPNHRIRRDRPLKGRSAALVMGIALLAACGSEPFVPATSGSAGDGGLDEALELVRVAYDLPALAGLIIHQDRVVEMAAVGTRVAGGPEPVAVDDLWHVGSITKSMTATAVARLEADGLLSWSTTISEALPELVGEMRADYMDVTLAELLSHTSGLREEITGVPIWPTLDTDVGPGTIEERHEWAAQLLALDPVRSRGEYLYSNGGYIVAGAMMEAISGRSWEALVQQEVFQPLGITSGGFGAPGKAGGRDQPWGHVREGGRWSPLPPGPGADNPAALGPAGTVHLSMADLALYALAHLHGAQGQGGLVEAESFQRLHTAAPGTNYALGWAREQQRWTGGVALTHNGSNTRWFARLWLAPGRDFAFFTVTNAAGERGEDGTNAAAILLVERFEAAFGG